MKIGILGSGQLGRMMALAGRPLGLTFSFYDTPLNPPISDLGPYFNPDVDDDALNKFIDANDVFTYEFENFLPDLAQKVAEKKPFYPFVENLARSQDRGREKRLFTELDIPVPPYEIARSEDEMQKAFQKLGVPVVVKTTTMGYDGKGQAVVRDLSVADTLWEKFQTEVIIEQFVPFRRELSQVAARNRRGDIVFYPLVENFHYEGILRYTLAPAPNLCDDLTVQAQNYVGRILDHLGYVGTCTLEMFETEAGLFANEMAARVHNSGHWTQDGAVTCQFENHLRGIMDWPLGQADVRCYTAMINIIGELNDPYQVLEMPGTHLHLYDKSERPGRKIGHMNICADSQADLVARIKELNRFLPACAPVLQ
jgi:5-(carboxyamino)imidazole ribonucleotide synthase